MNIRWVNVYYHGPGRPYIYSTMHNSRETADFVAGGHRIYCIRVTLK